MVAMPKMNDTRGNEADSKDEANNGTEQVGESQEYLIILGIIGYKN